MDESHRHTDRSRGAIVVGLIGLIAGSLGACGGSGRSVESYCTTVRTEQARLSAKYRQQADAVGSTNDPLLGLLGAVAMTAGVQGDLVVYFDRLSTVAPAEIEPEVEAVHDGVKALAADAKDSLSDPLGTIVGGLIGGMQLQGPLDVVNDYTLQHCGVTI